MIPPSGNYVLTHWKAGQALQLNRVIWILGSEEIRQHNFHTAAVRFFRCLRRPEQQRTHPPTFWSFASFEKEKKKNEKKRIPRQTTPRVPEASGKTLLLSPPRLLIIVRTSLVSYCSSPTWNCCCSSVLSACASPILKCACVWVCGVFWWHWEPPPVFSLLSGCPQYKSCCCCYLWPSWRFKVSGQWFCCHGWWW